MKIEWIAKLKIFSLPLSNLEPRRVDSHTHRRIKKAAPYYSNQVVCTILNYIFNESLNFHYKLACKIFFPILSTIKFYFSSSSLEIYFSFLSPVSHGRFLLVCMLRCEKCSCKHWDVSHFFLRLCCRLHKTPRLLSRWCLVLGVCCAFLFRRAARKKKTFGERECFKKILFRYQLLQDITVS